MKTTKKTTKKSTVKPKTKKTVAKTKKPVKKTVKSKKTIKKTSVKNKKITKQATKKPIKKTTVKKTKTTKRVNTAKPQQLKKQVKIVDKPIVLQSPNIVPENKVQEKSSKRFPITIFLISVVIAIAILITIANNINSNNEYYFSSNSSRFKYTVYENTQNINQRWISISDKSSLLSYAKDIKIAILDTKENSIFSIDPNEPFFQYSGEKYIALPTNKEYSIDYLYFSPADNYEIEFKASNDCVEIDGSTIKTKYDGSTIIYSIINGEKTEIINMDICSNIVERPKEFDETKPFLSCEQFTNEENELIDKILENKVNNVGYQTRAGAVETLRFLTLDFPYRVSYFSENGRLPNVDGEGRYYHKGLYLSNGKYNGLIDPSRINKGTWGCVIYSYSTDEYETNGVDCSGLLCWALYNDGFDPGDQRGANLLMDLGEVVEINAAVESNRIKVGDFVHNNELNSHVGMIIGIDGDDYYVVQSIWYNPFGVCVTKYSEEEFTEHWLQAILLDDYYKNDGQLTNMWY